MTRFLAYLSTLSVFTFIVVLVNGGVAYVLYMLAGVATLTNTLLLARVFRLTMQHKSWSPSVRYWMQAHVLLHLVPLSYLALQFFNRLTLFTNALYLLPVLLFFFSGRKTWQVLFEHFGSKMYRIFFAGNTGMMAGHVVLISLGVFYDARFGTEFFCRALVGYFTIHLLILGFSVVKIENDLSSGAPDVA